MAEIKIEVKNSGNNKVSATNSIVNSIGEKIQSIYNKILDTTLDIQTLYTNIKSLCSDVEKKVDTAISSTQNNIIEECQEFVDLCRDYATSDTEIDSELYSAKYYAENAKEWAIADDVIEETESGKELYSAKYYAEKIGNIAEGYITLLEELQEINGDNNE